MCKRRVNVSKYVAGELQKCQEDTNDKLTAFAIVDVKDTIDVALSDFHDVSRNNRLMLTVVSGDDVDGCMLAAKVCALAALSRLRELGAQI